MLFDIVIFLLIGMCGMCVCLNRDGSLTEEEHRKLEELCPNLIRGEIEDKYLPRYYNETKQCYQIGDKGPCPNNLVFHVKEKDFFYGTCDCDSSRNHRTLIYHPPTQTCYFIFTQAYCSAGEMVTLGQTSGQSKCVPNPCPQWKGKRDLPTEEDFIENEIVLVKDKCVRLGSPCEDNTTDILTIIAFFPYGILPFCGEFLGLGFPRSLGAIVQRCLPGSLLSISGNCQPHWVW